MGHGTFTCLLFDVVIVLAFKKVRVRVRVRLIYSIIVNDKLSDLAT